MFRTNDLQQNYALDQIEGIRRDLTELKGAQFVGGASLVTHYNTTDDTWDIDETVPNTITFIRWRVVFTPTSGGTPLSILAHNFELSPADPTRPILPYPDPEYVATDEIAFIIAFTNNNFTGDTDVRIRIAVTSVDTGTLVITKVYSA